MKKQYRNWLIENGFSLYTPTYKPSTVYDYLRGLRRVCIEENMTVDMVAANIDSLVMKYQPIGEKDWWITQGSDCPFANFKMPDSDEKIDTETFLSCLDKLLK
ncbi:MAG: hypothetical protein LBB23_00375 [Rickettsiales bacterium]|jgi:hypothetical protein|nr:hypothetical protein [Rickettsiales bacterium]